MTDGTIIRAERPEDIPAIFTLVAAAFAPMPFSDGTEPQLVNDLRAAGDLTVSLVALGADAAVIGHIGFSPVTVDGRELGWFQLAPLSVQPGLQRQGIGSALIAAGISAMRQRGARGISVVGNPAYYERFGFGQHAGFGPEGGDARYFRAMVLDDPAPQGVLCYAPAFG